MNATATNTTAVLKALSLSEIQVLMNLHPESLIHIEVEEVEGMGLQASLSVLTDQPGHDVSDFFQNSTPAWHYDRAGDWQGHVTLHVTVWVPGAIKVPGLPYEVGNGQPIWVRGMADAMNLAEVVHGNGGSVQIFNNNTDLLLKSYNGVHSHDNDPVNGSGVMWKEGKVSWKSTSNDYPSCKEVNPPAF